MMMLAQTRALIWEIVWRHRLGFLLTGVVAPGVALLLSYLSQSVPQFADVSRFAILLFFWGMIYIAFVCCYSSFNRKTYESGFPRHVMLMPIPTWLMVAVPMSLSVLLLFVFSAIWLEWVVNLESGQIHYGYTLVAIIIGVSWMQTLSWGLGNRPVIAMIVLISVVAVTALSLSVVVNTADEGLISPYAAIANLVVLLMLGIALAYRSVVNARQGRNLVKKIEISDLNLTGISMNRRLRSADQAQFRYELRVFGWVLPFAALMIGIVIATMQLLIPDLGDKADVTLLAIGFFLYITVISGHSFSQPHFMAQTHHMGSFWATRALGTVSLAHAKLKMAASSLVVAFVVLTLCIALGITLADQATGFQRIWMLLADRQGVFDAGLITFSLLILVAALAWCSCAIGMSVCIMGNKRLNVLSEVLVIAVVISVVLVTAAIEPTPTMIESVKRYAWLVLAATGLALMAFLIYLLSRYRRLASFQQLAIPALLCIGFLVFMLVTISRVSSIWPIGSELSLFVAHLALLSFIPFVAAPLALSKNRHR